MDKEKVVLINTFINKIRNGEDEYLNPLHDIMGPTLRYIALKYLRNDFDADDLVQDFWLNIHKTTSKIVLNLNGYSYLSKTMTRMAINRYHKIKRDRSVTVSYIDYSNLEFANQDTNTDTVLIRKSINQAMQMLDPKAQVIIQLKYFEDKTVREIGKELGISKSQVNRMLIKAREKMKSHLDNLLGDKINY